MSTLAETLPAFIIGVLFGLAVVLLAMEGFAE